MQTSIRLSNTLKSNKELSYRILAQVASSVPSRVRFDKVDFNEFNRCIATMAIMSYVIADLDFTLPR